MPAPGSENERSGAAALLIAAFHPKRISVRRRWSGCVKS
jgi:hypothetical protein